MPTGRSTDNQHLRIQPEDCVYVRGLKSQMRTASDDPAAWLSTPGGRGAHLIREVIQGVKHKVAAATWRRELVLTRICHPAGTWPAPWTITCRRSTMPRESRMPALRRASGRSGVKSGGLPSHRVEAGAKTARSLAARASCSSRPTFRRDGGSAGDLESFPVSTPISRQHLRLLITSALSGRPSTPTFWEPRHPAIRVRQDAGRVMREQLLASSNPRSGSPSHV